MEQPMVDAFSGSFSGKLLTVSYTLQVCIKHDYFCRSVEYMTISLPVTIMSPPIMIAAPQIVGMPEEWMPSV